ncbi:hypothetical protein HK102_000051 [Quaeritorhiza haematococci]|nr:hypothetical protein HK102_000051 [Quaeritorhiza haematococci]
MLELPDLWTNKRHTYDIYEIENLASLVNELKLPLDTAICETFERLVELAGSKEFMPAVSRIQNALLRMKWSREGCFGVGYTVPIAYIHAMTVDKHGVPNGVHNPSFAAAQIQENWDSFVTGGNSSSATTQAHTTSSRFKKSVSPPTCTFQQSIPPTHPALMHYANPTTPAVAPAAECHVMATDETTVPAGGLVTVTSTGSSKRSQPIQTKSSTKIGNQRSSKTDSSQSVWPKGGVIGSWSLPVLQSTNKTHTVVPSNPSSHSRQSLPSPIEGVVKGFGRSASKSSIPHNL